MSKHQQEELARECFPLWAAELAVLGETKTQADFAGRPWLWSIYDDESQRIAIRKGNQVGITAWALFRAIWGCWARWPAGCIYFLPFNAAVGDFVRQKVDPVIHQSLGVQPKSTDSVGMKALETGDLFFRGLYSEGGRQSQTADAIVLDERDMMTDDTVDDAIQRISASPYQNIIEVGRPSTADYGIDKAFNETDRKYWHLTCGSCSHEWRIEDAWPQCADFDNYRLWCPKCQTPADVTKGKWVAETQGYGSGYSVNAFLNPYANMPRIFRMAENRPGLFHRGILGLAYAEGGAALDYKHVLTLCQPTRDMTTHHPGPCTLGSDVGDVGHAVVLDKEGHIIRMFRWREIGELDRAMTDLHIGTAVIDALPEKRMSRDFCRRWAGRAYMCFYDKNRKGAPRWKDDEHTLQIDRTESLDASHTPLYTGATTLPREDEEARAFAKHCGALVRVVEELPDGSRIASWEKRGPEHYRHGFNYAWAARGKVKYQTMGY